MNRFEIGVGVTSDDCLGTTLTGGLNITDDDHARRIFLKLVALETLTVSVIRDGRLWLYYEAK